MIDQLANTPVRPVPTARPARAAYFRRPAVQKALASVESMPVDEETRAVLREGFNNLASLIADATADTEDIRLQNMEFGEKLTQIVARLDLLEQQILDLK